ncbi:MAG: 1-acyl-sn-glycerol-3-phosphate acyltransferase [Akkermansiaceae bacterium]
MPESTTQRLRALPETMDAGVLLPILMGEGWRRKVRDFLNRALGVHAVYDLFEKHADAADGNAFLPILDDHQVELAGGMLENSIPKSGAAIVIANHLFGGTDAISLAGICLRNRPDTLVMANAMTGELPGMQQVLIPLNIMGEEGATQANMDAMKRSLTHLRKGGVLVVFPAGAVSRWRDDLGRVADPEWSPHVARLARKVGVPVLPVKYFGECPLWFHLLGALHPIVRSALILRVFLSSKGKPIHYRAGKLLTVEQLRGCADDAEATSMMRSSVELIEES